MHTLRVTIFKNVLYEKIEFLSMYVHTIKGADIKGSDSATNSMW